MEKTMKARVQHKHDIEANWLKATNFTPLASEIIVYDPDENYDYPRIKIGDGKTNINTLPFITKDYAKEQWVRDLVDDSVTSLIVTYDAEAKKASHTSVEIMEYYNLGRNVVLSVNNEYLPIHLILDTHVIFRNIVVAVNAIACYNYEVNDYGYVSESNETIVSEVQSVNGKTGVVSLTASDVGALPSSTTIPTKTSQLTNDSGFINSYTETDPTVPEWAKQPNPPDVKIPDKLPNPYSITFTGAVNASYDGSDPVEITIPDSGGNAGFVVQDTAPEDTSVLWIDTSDNSSEGNPGDTSCFCGNADWNQNDETASDYVKNRTHYENTVEEYVIYEGTLVTFDNTEGIPVQYTIPVGTSITVYYNGSELATLQASQYQTNKDHVICNFTPDLQLFIYNDTQTATIYNGHGTETFKFVAKDLTVLKTLDEKYIPEAIARKTDIPTDEHIIDLIEENAPDGIAVTGATVGQTVKISAVDENGVPTAWAPTNFPTDEHINDLINTALGVIENGTY